MTQARIRGRDAVTRIGEEAVTFATTAASMLPAFLTTTDDSGGLDISGITTDELDVEDESVLMPDSKTTVQGLEGGDLKGFTMPLRPNTTQNAAAAVVVDDAMACALRCSLGGQYPAVGATNPGDILSGAAQTVTTLTVTTAGTRFAIGQWVGIETSLGLEFAQIINIASQVLTVNPALVGAPVATTGKVYGLTTWAPCQDNSRSVTVEKALAMSALHQHRFNGCKINLASLSLEIGKIPQLGFDIGVGSHTGPAALSVPVTVQTNPMAAPIAVKGSTVLLQASSASAVRTSQYTLEAFAPKFMPMNEHTPGMGGDTEGKVAVQVTGSRVLAGVDLTLSSDTVMDTTNWAAQGDQMFLVLNTFGSGTTRRASGFYMPTAQIVGKPKISVKGKRVIMNLSLRPKLNATTTIAGLTSTAMYFAYAPYYLFAG